MRRLVLGTAVLALILVGCGGGCPGGSCSPSLTYGENQYYSINPELFLIDDADVTRIGDGRAFGLSVNSTVFLLNGVDPASVVAMQSTDNPTRYFVFAQEAFFSPSPTSVWTVVGMCAYAAQPEAECAN
jgi:hypothetical protein